MVSGRKNAPIVAKKKSWREWKTFQGKKKKKKKASSDNDISKRGVIHATCIGEVVGMRNRASFDNSGDDDELLPSLGSESLAKWKC